MPTIYDIARGTNNINTDRVVVDMSDKIALLKPRVYPLTAIFSKLTKESTHNTKFEWLEDDLLARWTACPAGATNVATSFDVTAATGSLIAVNDLLKVTATGEVLKVTAVATDTVTVTRAYGETAAATIPAAADILIMGNAMAQGSGAPSEKYNMTVTEYNYTQIFKTPYSTTKTLQAIKLYGNTKEMARLRMKKGIEHGESIEYALLFGERKQDLTGSQPTLTTRGIAKFIEGSDNIADIDTTSLTKDEQIDALDAFMEKLYTYGSDVKMGFCSADFLTWMSGLERDKVRLTQSEKDEELGLNITSYLTPHGKLKLIHHPLLVKGYGARCYALDIEAITYRPLEGRDTHIETNIQNNDEDGTRDQYLTEAGLEFQQVKRHGLLTLTL